jgi:hypothetical protein
VNARNNVLDIRAAMLETIRDALPPAAGARWILDVDHCDAYLTTTHPIMGARRYPLLVNDGVLEGLANGQFEARLSIAPLHGKGAGEEVTFRSTRVSRAETFRYLAKGELRVATSTAIVVLRVHDLSWVLGQQGADRRIMTLSASLDRNLWERPHCAIATPWLTRRHVEVFIHTEWRAEITTDPAA